MNYRERVASLSKAHRQSFEDACDAIEDALLRVPSDLDLILAKVPQDATIRHLVLVNLGRCWLEGVPGKNEHRNVESLLQRCADLAAQEWAMKELKEFEKLMEAASGSSSATPANNGAATNLEHIASPDRREFSLPPGYRLEKELPRSGMGLVLLVLNEKLNRREVLKTIKPSKITDTGLNQRFRSEAKKLCETNHPSIITVYSADEFEGWPYFTMEYLEGGSLADRIGSKPIPARKAAVYVANIARALHVLHTKAGVVHRDIKPANMMFALFSGEGEKIKLGDFGLAKKAMSSLIPGEDPAQVSTMTEALTVFGTPGYIAPELLSEQFVPEGRARESLYLAADIFALGASLYQCVAGKLPYQISDSKTDVMGPVLNKYQPPSTFVTSIDPVFDAICERALCKNPLRRFDSAEEFAIALETWLASQRTEPMEPAPLAMLSATPTAKWKGWLASYPVYSIPLLVICAALILYFMAPGLNENRSASGKQPKTEVDYGGGREPAVIAGKNPVVAKLCEKGWPEDAAKEVAGLNQAWFDALSRQEKTAKLKGLYVETIGQLTESSSLPFERLQHDPYLASLLAVTDDPSNLVQDLDLHRETQKERLNLFVRYPTRQSASALTKAIKSHGELMIGLQAKGWMGSEIVLLGSSSNREGATEYQSWITDILQNYAISNNEKAAGYMAIVMIHGPLLRDQFAGDSNFRKRFLSQAWPKFKEVVAARNLKLENVLADPAVWKVLNEPGGEKLIHDFGLVPVVLLYGKDNAYPKNMHVRVVDLLQSKNDMITKALLNPKLQKKEAFHRLLKKNVTPTTIAVAIDRILSKGDGYELELEKVANWSDDQLAHELKAVKDLSPFEKIAPQGIYVHVGLKLLSGSAVYSDEWERLWYRSVRDVAIAVGQGYFEAGTSAVENFDKGYFGVIKATESVKEMRRKKREIELMREVGEDDRDYFDSALGTSEDYVRALEEMSNIPRLQSASKGNQLNPVLKFFRLQVGPSHIVGMRLPDLESVEFWSNRYGTVVVRFKDNCNFAREYPEIAAFFKTRADIVMGAKDESAPDAERAWAEMLSAWWLLNSNGLVPVSDR